MRVAAWVWMVGVVGCAGDDETDDDPRTSDEVIAEWDDWLNDHRDCVGDEDCAVVSPGCPLGCYAGVAAEFEQEARDLASALVDELGSNCTYSCVSAGPPECVQDLCSWSPTTEIGR